MDSAISDLNPHLEPPASLNIVHPLKIFDVARSQKRYLCASAPMVRYGKLAFRQTVHEYGTDLCWTPMILAKEFNRNHFARDCDLTLATSAPQPPTIVQFGANDPTELSRASSLAAPFVSGVDLNCGCPQTWACASVLGAALIDRRELVRDMVLATRDRLARDGWLVGPGAEAVESPRGRSVSVKIRVHKDLRKTIDFIETVVGDPHNRNIDFLTIHPRTRHTPSGTPIFSDALATLTDMFGDRLPILLSGDVFAPASLPPYPGAAAPSSPASSSPFSPDQPASLSASASVSLTTGPATKEDLPTFLPSLKLAGVMSARGLLANPALFAGHATCPWSAVETFVCRVLRAPVPLKLTQHHLSEMCGPGMGVDKRPLLTRPERAAMLAMDNMCDVVDFLDEKIKEKTGRAGLRRDP